MNRALVLLSGGKDSATALWWARQRFEDLITLSINHPERPRREALAARQLADLAGSKCIEITLPFINSVGEMHTHSGSFDTREAYVPMRNLLYFSAAAYIAETQEAPNIVAGQLRSDGQAYSDATPHFFGLLSALINTSASGSFYTANTSIQVHLPLIEMSDVEAIGLGREAGVPYEVTWSCLHDGDVPCHRCVSCRDRKRALG